ncbi:MAG TPA: hypothetical protein VKN64_07395 [Halanaerobiales bacterium]|nr:hypothetical protein [Halanaerobiales bacterium]
MKDNKNLKNNFILTLRKIARIWSIIILIISIIYLGGTFYNWITTGTADPYAVEAAHPPIIFLGIIGLFIALKKEKLGGIITVLSGISHLGEEIYLWFFNQEIPRLIIYIFSDELNYPATYYLTPYIVFLLILLPGILFWIIGSNLKNNI